MDMMFTLDIFGDIYRKNSKPDDAYFAVCKRFGRFSLNMTTAVYLAYLVSVAAGFLIGVTATCVSHGHIMPVHIPRVYTLSTTLLIISIMLSAVTAIVAVHVMLPFDMIFVLNFANVPMFPAIVRCLLVDLNTQLLRKSGEYAAQQIKRQFLRFIDFHREYRKLVLDKGCKMVHYL